MTSRNKFESEKGIKYSGSCCVICGWNETDPKGKLLVEGAHVKPFEVGAEHDNANNIIALCPNHHAEFDAGNFYIDPKTGIVHFRTENKFSNICIKSKIKHVKEEYLAYRQYIYEILNKLNV